MIRSAGYLLAILLGIAILLSVVFPIAIALLWLSLLVAPLVAAMLSFKAASTRWNIFLERTTIAIYGAVIPVALFFSSAYFLYIIFSAKSACPAGWLANFQTGKIALAPFVLWSAAAFFKAEVFQPEQSSQPTWVRLGLFAGAIVSVGNLIPVAAIVIFSTISGEDMGILLLSYSFIPAYTAVWYAILSDKYSTSFNARKYTALSTIPFWIGSLIWSYRHYLSLPASHNSTGHCFVVTAAAQGHTSLVGHSSWIEINGVQRLANMQLAIFWTFEGWWSERHPTSHRGFRRIYNRIGPVIAAQIKSPYLADAVYLALKPAELLAAQIIKTHRSA